MINFYSVHSECSSSFYLFLPFRSRLHYFGTQLHLHTAPVTSLSVNCRILHAYWMWLQFLFIPFLFFFNVFLHDGVLLPAVISDFISPWLPWSLTCVSAIDGRHQSVSGSNFKRRGGRKISRAEIARVEIPMRRQVVNPQCYERNCCIYPSSSHFHLCIRGGTLKVNSFFNHPSTFFQPSFTHFSTLLTLGHFNKKEESQLVHQVSVLTLPLYSEVFDCMVSDLSRSSSSSRVHPLEEPRYWWWKSSRGFAEWKAAGTDEYRQAVMRRRGSVH